MSAPSKLSLVIALFLAALVATATAPGQVGPRPEGTSKFAKIGEKAPDFKLVDTNGRERRLADYPSDPFNRESRRLHKDGQKPEPW